MIESVEASLSTSTQVRLTFFCELAPEPLESLFSRPALVEQLQALKAQVSLGIMDFSPERTAVVRRLNAAGIPVIAWQLLPKEQGYWYHLGNCEAAVRQYDDFLAWTRRQELEWAGIGIDIEPDIGEFELLLTQPSRLVSALWRRGCGKQRLCDGAEVYERLVARMQADGFPVSSYEFPFIVDELRTGCTWVRRLLGVTCVSSDQIVLMLYTSYFRPIGTAVLWSYARDADSVGIGVTGGGVQLEGVKFPAPLTWEEFSRDLLLATQWCPDIHIFSLEGCVEQGFLEPLASFDWNRSPKPPQPWAAIVKLSRPLFRLGLWLLARPRLSVGLLAGGVALALL